MGGREECMSERSNAGHVATEPFGCPTASFNVDFRVSLQSYPDECPGSRET